MSASVQIYTNFICLNRHGMMLYQNTVGYASVAPACPTAGSLPNWAGHRVRPTLCLIAIFFFVQFAWQFQRAAVRLRKSNHQTAPQDRPR
jgi:hypothetical protein